MIIGNGYCVGLILWSPRSPGSTPLVYLFWGFVKDAVYRERGQNVTELRDRIVKAAESVTSEILANT
jgi:hypothetical protein